ncbi:MAG: DUF2274 domain-containing protein [Burkholderiales bacterium]|nr:DUF2274 domain-containing protein [Burkholderiales bacterium]
MLRGLPHDGSILNRRGLLNSRGGSVYGEAVDAVTLIPHMLEAFMAADRGFRRTCQK